jgi:hypothetical protein
MELLAGEGELEGAGSDPGSGPERHKAVDCVTMGRLWGLADMRIEVSLGLSSRNQIWTRDLINFNAILTNEKLRKLGSWRHSGVRSVSNFLSDQTIKHEKSRSRKLEGQWEFLQGSQEEKRGV